MNYLLKLVIFLLFSTSAFAQYSAGPALPNIDYLAATKPLRNQTDQELQSKLEQKILSDKKMANLMARKKISIGLVDLQDLDNVRFAEINGDEMMYAASLPKIAVLLAAMDALESGELEDSPAVQKDMFLMINKSDNRASTRMIDRVGFEKIEAVLTDPRYKLYDENYGGGLWVGKRYAAQGKRNPDPMKGLSHAATATQVSRFYYMMVRGELVCDDRSRQMMDIMSDPGLHHKFVNTLDKVAPDAKLFRKSGSWRNYHADSVLVWGEDRRYILVALAEDAEGERTMRNLVTNIEEVLEIGK